MHILFSDLKAINEQIKASHTREFGYQLLFDITSEELSPGLAMYHAYLKGKYHGLTYKESGSLEDLERADDYFDEVISIAKDNSIRTKNPKYLFKRAYTKFLLSQILKKESTRQFFYEKASYLTDAGLRYHTQNESFIWLKSQL